jgi:hypothetical protein
MDNSKYLNIAFFIVCIGLGIVFYNEPWITKFIAFIPVLICYLLANIFLILADIHAELVVANARNIQKIDTIGRL